MIYGGIDAGGTSTKCILVSEESQVLAEVKTGPANYHVVGLTRAVSEVKRAVEAACREAEINRIDILGIGLAGTGRQKDIKVFREALLSLDRANQIFITDDGEIAVLGAHAGRPGLVVIAGTGSIVYGLSEDGKTIRAGGWGPILGDEGSGFWIGLKALQMIIKAKEGRAEKTSLIDPVLKKLVIGSLREELIPFIYQQRLPRKEIASLAPLVVRAMKRGDRVARDIIEEGLQELCISVRSVAGELRQISASYRLQKKVKVALTGGLFSDPFIYDLFSEKLMDLSRKHSDSYEYWVIRPLYSPVYGAVFFGLKEAGYDIISFLEDDPGP
ncbi:MAG: hypothetical protein PWR10_1454 [Halanaerobiales bacterium]|nr:hypothetical protein [Halanaerobiales bacterium]